MNDNKISSASALRARKITLALSLLLAAPVFGAAAQDRGPGIEFELGAGGSFAPRFEGSGRYQVSPFPTIRFGYLQLPNGFTLGGGDGLGFSFAPSFRYLGARDGSSAPELAGLADIGAAIELGAGIRYATGNARFFADIRRGVTGHSGVVGEIGADLIARPTDRLTLSAGPRLSWADQRYMRTYFGVTPGEASGSSFQAFDPAGGLKSAGIETAARYRFDDRWSLEAGASWNRLVGDAARSPVATAGSKDQFGLRLGLVRKFTVDFGR